MKTVNAHEAIFDYLRILHDYGVESSVAKEFKARYLNSSRDRILARGAERLFAEKDDILSELDMNTLE